MFAGLFVQFRLPAILTRTAFGSYSLVASMGAFATSIVVTRTSQTVSRFSAEEPGNARGIQAAGLRMHVVVGLPMAIEFVAIAPLVAWFLNDTDKVEPLML